MRADLRRGMAAEAVRRARALLASRLLPLAVMPEPVRARSPADAGPAKLAVRVEPPAVDCAGEFADGEGVVASRSDRDRALRAKRLGTSCA